MAAGADARRQAGGTEQPAERRLWRKFRRSLPDLNSCSSRVPTSHKAPPADLRLHSEAQLLAAPLECLSSPFYPYVLEDENLLGIPVQ
jgi:hypothetical protein